MSQSFIDSFQDLRTLLCVCPCCGEIVRASDLHISDKGKAPKTWLDDYDAELYRLAKRLQEFEEKASEIRDQAVERGRRQVVSRVCSCLEPKLARFNFDPYDIKALYHPTDFVVFDGLNLEELDQIIFLCKKRSIDAIQKSLKSTINDGKIDFKVARVTDEGGVKFE